MSIDTTDGQNSSSPKPAITTPEGPAPKASRRKSSTGSCRSVRIVLAENGRSPRAPRMSESRTFETRARATRRARADTSGSTGRRRKSAAIPATTLLVMRSTSAEEIVGCDSSSASSCTRVRSRISTRREEITQSASAVLARGVKGAPEEPRYRTKSVAYARRVGNVRLPSLLRYAFTTVSHGSDPIPAFP